MHIYIGFCNHMFPPRKLTCLLLRIINKLIFGQYSLYFNVYGVNLGCYFQWGINKIKIMGYLSKKIIIIKIVQVNTFNWYSTFTSPLLWLNLEGFWITIFFRVIFTYSSVSVWMRCYHLFFYFWSTLIFQMIWLWDKYCLWNLCIGSSIIDNTLFVCISLIFNFFCTYYMSFHI